MSEPAARHQVSTGYPTDIDPDYAWTIVLSWLTMYLVHLQLVMLLYYTSLGTAPFAMLLVQGLSKPVVHEQMEKVILLFMVNLQCNSKQKCEKEVNTFSSEKTDPLLGKPRTWVKWELDLQRKICRVQKDTTGKEAEAFPAQQASLELTPHKWKCHELRQTAQDKKPQLPNSGSTTPLPSMKMKENYDLARFSSFSAWKIW